MKVNATLFIKHCYSVDLLTKLKLNCKQTLPLRLIRLSEELIQTGSDVDSAGCNLLLLAIGDEPKQVR